MSPGQAPKYLKIPEICARIQNPEFSKQFSCAPQQNERPASRDAKFHVDVEFGLFLSALKAAIDPGRSAAKQSIRNSGDFSNDQTF
jgi:hypothetical protein